MGTSQLTVSGGVLLLNGSPVGGGGSVGTLQTVTDNGATTTNSVTFDRSASGSGSAIVVKPSAGGKGINVLGNGAIEFLSPSGGQYYSSIQPGFESLSIGVANGGFVINVSSLTTQITNQLQASGLRYPTSDGTAGQVLSTNGSGTLSWITAGGGSVGTLQTVTDNGATTTNTIRLFDSVTSFEAITLDPQSGLISILPQALGDPGLYLSPTGATIGNSTGSFRSAGLFPCAVNFNGSAGASLQTAGDGFPVQLWAGGTNLIGSPQVSVTGTATTISNQLIVRDANYQRFSVDNSTGLVRIGNGAAAAGGSPGLEIYTPGSTTPTVDIEGSTGSILTLGTITIDGTNNGNYPLIVKSGSGAQSLRIVGRTSDFRSIIDFTNPAQTVSLWNIQALPSTLTFGNAGSQYLAITSGTTSVNNNLQVAGTFKVQSLTYPTSDGTANQVLSTNGSGTLGWITTAKVVATPGSSAAGGNDNEISFDAAGNFYFFKGGSWWKVAGSSF
jgi:hypothetical protein